MTFEQALQAMKNGKTVLRGEDRWKLDNGKFYLEVLRGEDVWEPLTEFRLDQILAEDWEVVSDE